MKFTQITLIFSTNSSLLWPRCWSSNPIRRLRRQNWSLQVNLKRRIHSTAFNFLKNISSADASGFEVGLRVRPVASPLFAPAPFKQQSAIADFASLSVPESFSGQLVAALPIFEEEEGEGFDDLEPIEDVASTTSVADVPSTTSVPQLVHDFLEGYDQNSTHVTLSVDGTVRTLSWEDDLVSLSFHGSDKLLNVLLDTLSTAG